MCNSNNTNRLKNCNKNVATSTVEPTSLRPSKLSQNFSATSPKRGLDAMNKARQNNTGVDYLLNINEVCQVLNIGRSSIYNLINGKRLTAVKLAGRTLFRRVDLVNFIDSLPEYQGEQYGF